MLQLTSEEQTWLDAYREALNKQHPGIVQEMLIYGSKARGQAHAESDVDIILNRQEWRKSLRAAEQLTCDGLYADAISMSVLRHSARSEGGAARSSLQIVIAVRRMNQAVK